MKIGLRGGHSPNCKGAIGILDEQIEVRKIYSEMVPILQAAGHTVVDCNSNSPTVNGELSEGTNKANGAGCDIYVTLHMNASGGSGNGTEVWLYDASKGMMNEIADRICQNFQAKGFQNRGRKYNAGYHDLNVSAMPAMIVETLFCDNNYDADLYRKVGVKGIAGMIASAIVGKEVVDNGVATPPAQTSKPQPQVQISDVTPGVNFTYGVRLEDGTVLPPVTNLNDCAGIQGRRIVDISIKVNKGSVRYRVHLLGDDWLPWVTGYNWNDHNNGYAGNGKTIDAVQVDYETPTDYASRYGYQKAQYHVSPVNGNYWEWQYDTETGNGQDGFAGCFGQALDRFQLF